MAFGQQAGPPATTRQVQELTELVHAAGHEGLREARHPLGLSQRQAAGRFTRDEADEAHHSFARQLISRRQNLKRSSRTASLGGPKGSYLCSARRTVGNRARAAWMDRDRAIAPPHAPA